MSSTNIAKITYRNDLLHADYIARSYQPPPHQCQNFRSVGQPAKNYHSTDNILYVPILVMIIQTALYSHARVLTVFHRAALPTSLSAK